MVSIAATLTNLLPLYNMQEDNAVEEVYAGDGRLPVQAKLAQKIWPWEFVDMGELFSEFSQCNNKAHNSKMAMEGPRIRGK